MARLADHWSDGEFLDIGWHDVKITDVDMFQYNSGSNGVAFSLEESGGKTAKASFCLKDSILWRLSTFASACGITKEDAASYDTDSMKSHRKLIGKNVRVLIEKIKRPNADKAYKEVTEWESVDAPQRSFVRPDDAGGEVAAAVSEEDEIPF